MADRVGQQLGNYRLIRLLGQGGFAEVYLGEHMYLKTPGAIKLLHTKGANQKELEGFLKEAQAIAQLVHPHIVRVLEFGVHEEETPFLVMDYAANGTLRQQYPRKTQLPLTAIIPYVRQISAALQYAHDARIIHRDVKPENMLLGRDNKVLLSDFGIALLAQNSNSLSIQEVAGTAAYMAPEQFQGKPRLASDQYALSLVVYEWLTGDRPFHGSFIELATQHIFNPPSPLHEKVPTISPAVEHVVLRALAKEPQERYASIGEFAKELERAAALSRPTAMAIELPLTPTPPQTPRKAAPRLPRRTVLKQATVSSYPTPAVEKLPFAPTPPDIYQKKTLHLLPNSMPFLSLASFSRMDRRWRVLAVFLCLLILGVLGAEILPGIVRQQQLAMANANAAATVTAAADAYTKATDQGIQFGFDAAHTRWNRYEQVINATNLSHLIQMWSYHTGGSIGSSPTVANGIMYVGSMDHGLYAFDANCRIACTPPWAYPTGGGILSSPAVANGMVYVGSGDDRFYAFDARCRSACQPLWSYLTGSGIGSSPTVANGMVYVGSNDHRFYAFDASCRSACQPLWSYLTGDHIFSSAAVANGIVYVGSLDKRFYAFDASCRSACQPLWSYPTGGIILSSPAVANGMVYVGSYDRKLYAFDARCRSDCTPLWSYSAVSYISSSPAVANGVVYIGSMDHRLYAFNAACRSACTPLWSYITAGLVRSSPTVANNVIYIGSDDHRVYAFNAACRSACTPLWSYPTDGYVEAGPAVANGIIYISSDDGSLYAFGFPK
jgi:eukaryotic-like serine/threonine-protein kinase